MEKENKKSRMYMLAFLGIIIFAIILSIYQRVHAPAENKNDVQKENVGLNTGILGNENDLVLLSIVPNAKLSGMTIITGEVKGGYFFERNILVNILDKDKKVLRNGYGTATTDWMTAEPVSFTSAVDFTGLTAGPAYLEIKNDNPSGDSTKDKSILIPIIIE